MKSDDDCKTYQDQHLEPMLARAKEQGAKVLAQASARRLCQVEEVNPMTEASSKFLKLTRSVSASLSTLRTNTPEVMRNFGELGRAATSCGKPDTRTKELIALALSVAARCGRALDSTPRRWPSSAPRARRSTRRLASPTAWVADPRLCTPPTRQPHSKSLRELQPQRPNRFRVRIGSRNGHQGSGIGMQQVPQHRRHH